MLYYITCNDYRDYYFLFTLYGNTLPLYIYYLLRKGFQENKLVSLDSSCEHRERLFDVQGVPYAPGFPVKSSVVLSVYSTGKINNNKQHGK